MPGEVIPFPRAADPAAAFDFAGNLRVGHGRTITRGHASVTRAQADYAARFGWAVEPDSLDRTTGRVIISRDLPRPSSPDRLKVAGVARDAGDPQAITVAFSRPLSDDELRMFHDACRQAAALVHAAQLS